MIRLCKEGMQEERENKLKSEKDENWQPPPFSDLWR